MNRRLGIRIGFLIHDVSRLRRVLFDSRSPHLDITRSEAWVLTGISRRSSGISQTELAKVLGLGKVATGEFVGDLERKGFVIRRLVDGDRRAYSVQLTQRGRNILSRISDIVTQMNVEIFENVSALDLQQFFDTLKNMKLRLIAMTEDTPEAELPKAVRSKSAVGRVAISQRSAGILMQSKTKRAS